MKTLTSLDYYSRALQVLPGGAPGKLRREFHTYGPLVVSRAKAAYLWDVEGKEFIDYHMAFGAIVLGHSDPEVVRSVTEQAPRLILHGAGVADVEIELAETISKLIPTAERVVFTNSGSEAVMLAIRLARAYTGRTTIVKFEGNYHGWHDYSLYNVTIPITAGKKAESAGIPPEVQGTIDVLPYNDEEALEKYMEEKGDKVAAIILEPVAHSMGVVPARKQFLHKVEKLAREHGALLVFDEIITAIRHNIHGLQAELGVKPDLTTIGKAVANGMPLAALVGRKEVMDLLSDKVVASGTYSAHPLSMAAGLATLEKLEKLKGDQVLARKGEEHAKVLKDLVEDVGVQATVSAFRSIFTIYFGLDEQPLSLGDVVRANERAYRVFNREMRRRGILFSPNPRKRMHVCLAHTDRELEIFREAAERALRRVREEVPELRA